jgi:hypothetical protein
VSELVCGEPGALSLTEIVAASVPVEFGSNVTVMVQDAPAASVLPQVLVLAKDALLAPVRLRPVIVSGALPVLVSVAFCAVLVVPLCTEPKFSVAGVSVAAGAAAVVPAPVRVLVCGEPLALSETLRIAVAEPVAVGAKVTERVHEEFAARDAPQVFDAMANTEALAPPRVTELIERAALPALVRVKVLAELVVPAVTLPKFAEAGVRAACGAGAAVPEQVKAMDCCGIGDGKFAPRFAVKAPVAAGVQVTAREQLAPAATLEPQLFVSLKELVLLPKNPKLLMVSGAVPVF